MQKFKLTKSLAAGVAALSLLAVSSPDVAAEVTDGSTLRGTLKIVSSSPTLSSTVDEITGFSLTFNQRMKLSKPNTWVSSNVYETGYYDNSSHVQSARPEGAYYWVPSIDENDDHIVNFTLRGLTDYANEGDAKHATFAGDYQIFGASTIQSAETTYKMSIMDEMKFTVTGNFFGKYDGQDEPDTTPFDIAFNIMPGNISAWPATFALTGFPSTPNAVSATVDITEATGVTFKLPVTVGSYGVSGDVKLPAADVKDINRPGTYTISFPEGFFTCGQRKSNALTATFVYGDGVYVAPVEDDDTNSFALANIYPPAGSTIDALGEDSDFLWPSLIKLGDFPAQPTGADTLTVMDEDGATYKVPVNYSWYGMFDNCVLLQFFNSSIEKSGTYTINIPRGFFTANGLPNRELSYTYKFVNPDSDTPPTTEDFEVKSFTLVQDNGTRIDLMAPDAKIGSMSGIGKEDTFILDTSHNDKIGYVQLDITTMAYDEEAEAEVESTFIFKSSTAKNEDGARVIYAFSGTEDFEPGKTYWVNVYCYNAEYPIGYPSTPRTLIGKARYEITGNAVPYEYSPYKLVSIYPEPDSEITDPETAIVMTFDGPVNLIGTSGDDAQTYIAEGPGSKHLFASVTSNADKTVWTLVPGASYLKTQKSGIRTVMKAIDNNGKVVQGNSAVKEASAFGYTYVCQIGVPTVVLTPADGSTVDSLFEFTAKVFNTPIALGSSLDRPRLYDSKGNEVAEVVMASEVMYDAGGNVMSGSNINDTKAMSISFTLDKTVSTPGTYTLRCPFAAFALGTESNGYSSKYTEYTYIIPGEVVDPSEYAVIEFSIGGYAGLGYKTKKNEAAAVRVEESEDWMLTSLTLNGEDVTSDVAADGTYTIPAEALVKKVSLKAEFEFVHELNFSFVTGVDKIEGCAYKVYSDGGMLVIEGLSVGDDVRVYSINGMTLCCEKMASDTFAHPFANGIYVVMVNGQALKVEI